MIRPPAMSERTVGIYPQTRYDFLPNATYHVPWNFLPYERAKVIAEHLTYLAFHEWLMDNLRHATQHEPESPDWSRLSLSVARASSRRTCFFTPLSVKRLFIQPFT